MIYYTVKIFENQPGITAGVTRANRQMVNTDERIPGLNFGENTGITLEKVTSSIGILEKKIGTSSGHALAEQVHGNKVTFVNNGGYYPGYDGLITDQNNLLLGIKIADCAALLISDPKTGLIAATHAGWRGAAGGIAEQTLEELSKRGADPEQLYIYMSPCISVKNFEIGEEVASQFPDSFIDRSIGKKPHLDLKGFIRHTLMEYGVQSKRIEVDDRCTVENTSFYSFRREREQAGRMLAFIRQSKT